VARSAGPACPERARLAARHGHLKKPAPRGKLAWIIAGDSADSVLLACGLAQALRERRLDLQLAVTVERPIPISWNACPGWIAPAGATCPTTARTPSRVPG